MQMIAFQMRLFDGQLRIRRYSNLNTILEFRVLRFSYSKSGRANGGNSYSRTAGRVDGKRDEIEGNRLMARDESRLNDRERKTRNSWASPVETSLGITDSCGHSV